MKIILFLLVFIPTVIFKGRAQDKKPGHSLYAELGKTGLIYNLYYDYKYPEKKLGLRAGLGSNFGKHLNLFTFGAGCYFLFGNKNKHLELGLDFFKLNVYERSNDQRGLADSFIYPDYPVNTPYVSLNIGYRHYGKKTLFRAGVSPGFISHSFLHGGYLSFGLRI